MLVGPVGNQADISALVEINKLKKKITWAERKVLIQQSFPRLLTLNWLVVFDDPHVLGMALQDILKVDSSEPGRDGPRPAVNEDRGIPRLRQLWDEDYSYLPVQEALAALQHSRRLSVRGLAAKVGLSYSMIFRFLNGKATPTVPELAQIAKAFRKDPAYFLEFRMAILEAALEKQMRELPELSVAVYKKVVKV